MPLNRFPRYLFAALLAQAWLSSFSMLPADAQQGLPADAHPWKELSGEGVTAVVHENTLWLQLDAAALKQKKVAIPRLCAPMRSLGWKQNASLALKFVPEPTRWVFSWAAAPAEHPTIEVTFDRPPVLPDDCPRAASAGDGSLLLHAYQARTAGEKLRFEPQSFKNTVGYWTEATDYATWELQVDQPGTYAVAVLQGCGRGQGGSEAALSLHKSDKLEAQLVFETIDTGHFQNFRWHHLGTIEISSAGDYQLKIAPRRIAKAALFDVRNVHLVRQAKAGTP